MASVLYTVPVENFNNVQKAAEYVCVCGCVCVCDCARAEHQQKKQ